MPKNQTGSGGVGTANNPGGITGQGAMRTRQVRRRTGRGGGRGKHTETTLPTTLGTSATARFAGMSAQQIYDLGARHERERCGLR